MPMTQYSACLGASHDARAGRVSLTGPRRLERIDPAHVEMANTRPWPSSVPFVPM
jgi:hypothetical protein